MKKLVLILMFIAPGLIAEDVEYGKFNLIHELNKLEGLWYCNDITWETEKTSIDLKTGVIDSFTREYINHADSHLELFVKNVTHSTWDTYYNETDVFGRTNYEHIASNVYSTITPSSYVRIHGFGLLKPYYLTCNKIISDNNEFLFTDTKMENDIIDTFFFPFNRIMKFISPDEFHETIYMYNNSDTIQRNTLIWHRIK